MLTNSYNLTMKLKLSECKILSSLNISFDNVQNYDGICNLISIFALTDGDSAL